MGYWLDRKKEKAELADSTPWRKLRSSETPVEEAPKKKVENKKPKFTDIFQPARFVGDVIKSAFQGFNREVTGAALTALSGGKEREFKTGSAGKVFLGTDTIKTTPKRIREAGQNVEEFRGTPKGSQPQLSSLVIGSLGVGVSQVLDTYFSGGGSVAKQTTKQILKGLAKKQGRAVTKEVAEQVAKEVKERLGKKLAKSVQKQTIQELQEKFVRPEVFNLRRVGDYVTASKSIKFRSKESVKKAVQSTFDDVRMMVKAFTDDPKLAKADPDMASKIITKQGNLAPELAVSRARDIATKLEAFKKGAGTKFIQAVDLEKSSMDDLLRTANNVIDDVPVGKLGMSQSERYVSEITAKRELARGGQGLSIKGGLPKLYQEAKKKLADFNAPIEDVLRVAQKKGKYQVLPENHISYRIDRALRAPTLAGEFARSNGLEDVIKKVDNLENLDQYLIAKHALRVEGRGVKTGRDLVRDKRLIEEFAPRYEESAKAVSQYARKLLDYAEDSGLVSKELATELKVRYPDYVPLNRIFSEIEEAGGQTLGRGRGPASISTQSIIQRLQGSDREIESPMASLLSKTYDSFVQGERNKAARVLISYKDLPGNPFGLKALEGPAAGKSTVSGFVNGVKQTYETSPEIAQAAKALNVQQLNILGRIFAAPVRLAKLGITGINLPFVGANVARDQIFTAITSKNSARTSLANPVNFVRSLFSAFKHDDLYHEMVRMGAGGTSFDIARDQPIQTIARIRAGRSLGSKIKYTIRHPGELLRSVEDIVGRSEELSRMTQYRGTKEALKGTMSNERAAIEAARAAMENSANFYRRGEWGTVLNSAFLYLNASIQGSRAFIRSVGRDPIRTGAKVATILFAPMATMTAWNLSDPKRREAYADIAEYERENNFIIVPPNPTKDEQGRWNIIKIPLPPGVGKLTIPVRKALEQSFGVDELKFRDIANALVSSVSPIEPNVGSVVSTLTPQALKPSLEAITNQNFFTGIPQVPQSQEKLSPELQVKDYTSGTARKVGGALNASPIKVEEFIKGTFGGVGSQVLHASDRILAGLDIIPKSQVGGQNVIEAIVSRFSKARGGEIDRKLESELKDILTEQADESFRLKQEAEILNDEFKELPKEEANRRAREIKKADPLLFDKLKSVIEDERADLSYGERLIKQLQVKNGERAKFIFAQTEAMGSKEERNAYIKKLRAKKVISDEVMSQIKKLIREKYQ